MRVNTSLHHARESAYHQCKNVPTYFQIPPNGALDCTPMTSRPPSSVGPNSLLSTPGIGRRKPHTNSNMAGDGWQTVGAMTPNKFQLKRVKKKYIEPGTSVICIHSKVRKFLLSSEKFFFKKRFLDLTRYCLGCFS